MSSLYTKNKEANKAKLWWDNLPKKKKVITVCASSALLAGIIAGGVAISIANSQKTYTPQDAVSAMLTVDGVKPASIIVAPASETWWKVLLNSNPNVQLENVKYNEISKGAQYISSAMSNGKQYTGFQAVGVPTTFIAYSTTEEAQAASTLLDAVSIPHITSGNFLLFLVEGAYSDVDYALDAYNNVAKDNATMKSITSGNKASWTFNFADFATTFTKGLSDNDKEVYTKLMSEMGVTKDTTWAGTSTDGLVWKGSFSNLKEGNIAKPADIMTYLSTLITFTNLAGEPTQKYQDQEGDEIQTGLQDLHQAMIGSCCMIISNTDSTAGTIINGAELEKGKELGNKGILEVKIAPNPWLGILSNRTAYEFTGYKTVDILLTDKNGSSTITFVPLEK